MTFLEQSQWYTAQEHTHMCSRGSVQCEELPRAPGGKVTAPFLICGAFICACGGKSVGPEDSLGRGLLSASSGPLWSRCWDIVMIETSNALGLPWLKFRRSGMWADRSLICDLHIWICTSQACCDIRWARLQRLTPTGVVRASSFQISVDGDRQISWGRNHAFPEAGQMSDICKLLVQKNHQASRPLSPLWTVWCRFLLADQRGSRPFMGSLRGVLINVGIDP